VKHSHCSTEKLDPQAVGVARYQHWADLAATAAKLLEPPVDHSRVFADRDWTLEDADPYLSQCLTAHLEAEFPSVSWPRDFDGWTRADTKFREIFRLVSRRRTFVGTCQVCEQWDDCPTSGEVSIISLDAIEAFLTLKADGGASDGYLRVLARKLRQFAKEHRELPTNPELIRTYLRRFKTSDVPTRQDQWKALSMLYRFASDRYGVPNPMPDVDKPRFKKKTGQRLSREGAKILITALRSDLEWGLVTCYFGLRFRRVEAQRLRFGDINSDYIIVQGKERTEELPLLPLFRDMLLRLRNDHGPNDPVFWGQQGPINADTMAWHIERVFKRARIEGVRGSPHTLRNTAGALWSTFGGDWTSNRQLLRHSAKTMTDHYSPLTIDELRAKDERHNPMLSLMRELGLAPPYPNTSSAQLP